MPPPACSPSAAGCPRSTSSRRTSARPTSRWPRDDRARYAELVEEFHDLLIRGADNTKLEAHYRMLMNQLAYSRLVITSLSQPGRPLQSDREHHVVLDLIIAKDGDSAERVMREHVRASRRALLAGLRDRRTPRKGSPLNHRDPSRGAGPRRDDLRGRGPGHDRGVAVPDLDASSATAAVASAAAALRPGARSRRGRARRCCAAPSSSSSATPRAWPPCSCWRTASPRPTPAPR